MKVNAQLQVLEAVKLNAATKKMEKAQKQIERKNKKLATPAGAPAPPSGVIKEPKRRQPKKAPEVAPKPADAPSVEMRTLPTWPEVAAWTL